MIGIPKRSLIIVIIVLLVGMMLVTPALAVCNPSDFGTPHADVIICNTFNQPVSNLVGGDLGNDLIIIGSGSSPDNVAGDSSGQLPASANGGNDTILVQGAVYADVYGEYGLAGGGNDRITVTGSVGGNVFGDYASGTHGGGNDVIRIFGTVDGNVSGDTTAGADGGNDTIIIDGTVGAFGTGTGSVFGDDTNFDGGNDTIIVNGTVRVHIFGDFAAGNGGNDTIIISGTVNGVVQGDNANVSGGDDVVRLKDGAEVGGIIDGGDGEDTLRFDFTFNNAASAHAFAQQVANLSPAGDTLTFQGHTYTWINFEHLVVG